MAADAFAEEPQPDRPARPLALTPENSVVVLVSFEGTDLYSQAGGLGVRVSGLAHTLAELGYETHLFFIGDPTLPGEERVADGRLVLHRWGQWISASHPGGVYDGEEDKRIDLVDSLPPYIAERVILPALAAGRIPLVLSEEWQTAEFAWLLSDHLHALGVRDRCVLFWNANNPYSFNRIDWPRLAFTNTVTTVSRHMRGIMRSAGVDALVIPNGIPLRLVASPSGRAPAALRSAAGETRLLFKMARWEREKGWIQALDAVAELRDRGRRVTLLARSGGPAGTGSGLHAEAGLRELSVEELSDAAELPARIAAAGDRGVNVLHLRFGVSESLARTLFAATDAVLANSISEPFGLVGLEAMAAGGIVFTGGTGEDYAVSGRNAVVLETLEPSEIANQSEELAKRPELASRLRRAARRTARLYTWDRVVSLLVGHLGTQAARQGLLDPAGTFVAAEVADDPAAGELEAGQGESGGTAERDVPLVLESDDAPWSERDPAPRATAAEEVTASPTHPGAA